MTVPSTADGMSSAPATNRTAPPTADAANKAVPTKAAATDAAAIDTTAADTAAIAGAANDIRGPADVDGSAWDPNDAVTAYEATPRGKWQLADPTAAAAATAVAVAASADHHDAESGGWPADLPPTAAAAARAAAVAADALAAPTDQGRLGGALLSEVVGTAILVAATVGGVVAATVGTSTAAAVSTATADAATTAGATAEGPSAAAMAVASAVAGVGLFVSILIAGPRSGAHLNPAVSLAVAINRPACLPLPLFAAYVVAQTLGAFVGGAAVYSLWHGPLGAYEAAHSIRRGTAASAASAAGFACAAAPQVTLTMAVAAEMAGTAALVAVIAAVMDGRRGGVSRSRSGGRRSGGGGSDGAAAAVARAAAVGATYAALEVSLGPLTGGCFNSARDFGPRVVLAMAKWGRVAFPGAGNGWWVYMVAPMLGGPLGMAAYDALLRAPTL